jgi:hypothetical protein
MDILRLKKLAISDSGFIFDPATGHSYTTNDVGGEIIAALKAGSDPTEIVNELTERYEVTADVAERDVIDFVDNLKKMMLA